MLQDRHLRLLLPRGPAARDLQGHDAAVHRAERRALADAARRARVHGAVARGPHAARRQQGDASTPTRSELDGLVLMGGSDVCPRVVRREGAAARVERRPHPRRLRDRAAARVHGAAQAGARRLPRRAGDQRRAGRHALPGHRARRCPHALNHRNWAIYEQNCHATSFVPGSGLARLYPGDDASSRPTRSTTRR